MRFLRIMAGAGVVTIGFMNCAFSHATSHHYVAHPTSSSVHHDAGHHSPSVHHVSGHSAKPSHSGTATHPAAAWHGKSYHAPPHSWQHHYSSARIYRKPAPPPLVPGKTADGRYVLPGGMESVCAGGTPPPCE
jgi:hypothetical protein